MVVVGTATDSVVVKDDTAVPVLLEIGKEHINGTADDQLLGEAAADLIAEATGRP